MLWNGTVGNASVKEIVGGTWSSALVYHHVAIFWSNSIAALSKDGERKTFITVVDTTVHPTHIRFLQLHVSAI
jgi:hypothetical protein